MANATMPTTAKVAKTNPSQSYIGMEVTSKAGVKNINFRQGKGNVLSAAKIKITGANNTGRRLQVEFYDENGNVVQTRRVYKEWVDRIIDQLEK